MSCRWADKLGGAALHQRPLGSLKDPHDQQAVFTTGQGHGSGEDAIHEVLAFLTKWLTEVNLRDQDVAGTKEELELTERLVASQ